MLSQPPLASVSDIGNFWGRYRSSKVLGKVGRVNEGCVCVCVCVCGNWGGGGGYGR
jgi:hypothetical protein